MPGLSEFSKGHLNTCHPILQRVVVRVANIYEVRVLCGARPKEEQTKLFAEGRTKVQYPNSKHNIGPDIRPYSHAVDVVPYPIDWNDSKRFIYLAGLMIGVAKQSEDIDLRWGGNWNMDMVIIDDQKFDDLPHYELLDSQLSSS